MIGGRLPGTLRIAGIFHMATHRLSLRLLPAFLLSCSIIAGAAGCRPSNRHYVVGTVRYPDGSPVPEGRLLVDYGPGAKRQAGALIRSDGSFRIGEINDGDGMPAGTFKVGVSAFTEMAKDGQVWEVSLCDRKYSNPQTSGLVFEVPKQLRWEIVVEKPADDPAPAPRPPRTR